jgi:hypothetical protein
MRIDCLVWLYKDTCVQTASAAKALAAVEFAAFVGLQHIQPRQPAATLAVLDAMFTRLLATPS